MILKFLLQRRKLKLTKKLKKFEEMEISQFTSVNLLNVSFRRDMVSEISAIERVLKFITYDA